MVEIDWNAVNTRELCKLFAEQVRRGNRPNTYLNSVGYAEVEKGMKDRLGIEVSKLQIKNKWDKLKEDFKAWKKLAVSDIPGCGKFRKQGLQNEEDLQVCFGSIISIGTDHWSPHIASAEEGQNGTNEEDTAEDAADIGQNSTNEGGTQEDPSPVNENGKRAPRFIQEKGKKPKTGTALLIQEAVTSMATSASSYASKKEGKYSIDEVMGHVLACGADYESNEYFIASELFVKKEQREMFMTFPSNEFRFSWLTRKYMGKYGK
ncbi:L10-interacting MYB domain-containing protein-like [Panicum hallii]|uniref:L10-interacting MYB domain-containing protein-like n=1 Tax=Panicum hallii TaxID=206008 RepID=UPI000DF4EC20|nr:L10-interacting MYB domain-containing protein-like [Panicum hallii]